MSRSQPDNALGPTLSGLPCRQLRTRLRVCSITASALGFSAGLLPSPNFAPLAMLGALLIAHAISVLFLEPYVIAKFVQASHQAWKSFADTPAPSSKDLASPASLVPQTQSPSPVAKGLLIASERAKELEVADTMPSTTRPGFAALAKGSTTLRFGEANFR